MSSGKNPSLSLAIKQLKSAGTDNVAIWVIKSPYAGGHAHHDCNWSVSLSQKWRDWQEMFSPTQYHFPIGVHQNLISDSREGIGPGYGARLMQEMAINLWQWLFDGSISASFAQSQGIAMGQNFPLRLRLEIRDPNFIPLPWEIMQSETGKPAISLNQQILFSRTRTDVLPLHCQKFKSGLYILLVLGQDTDNQNKGKLQLEKESQRLANVIKKASSSAHPNFRSFPLSTRVDTLLQPTRTELIEALDSGIYNLFFYSGHGIPGADGGLLFLRPDDQINGTELAQVLVRNHVTLALFNSCWGAQPYQEQDILIENSSLTEVLIHHGVPAVLGMRDSIADEEALSFIEAFAKALCEKKPLDQATAIARQQLLTLYKFNQPAWTLPILYMHPDFEGDLIDPLYEETTQFPPDIDNSENPSSSFAVLRSVMRKDHFWRIQGGHMRIGRRNQENDVIIAEKWVSGRHATIVCRESQSKGKYQYYLDDDSRYGTFVGNDGQWQKINHQEILLESGVQLKFGSIYGETLEFFIEP